MTRSWTDNNGNYTPDCNLLNLQSQDLRSSGGDFCGTVSNLSFGLPTSVTNFNNDLRFGWNNRTYNWEFSGTVQHQLAPRVAVEVGYFRRIFGNLPSNTVPLTKNLAVDASRLQRVQHHCAVEPRPARRRRLRHQRTLQPQPGQSWSRQQLRHLRE